MDMTVHTLKYIHKRRGFGKAEKNRTSTRISTRTTKTKDHRRYCKYLY